MNDNEQIARWRGRECRAEVGHVGWYHGNPPGSETDYRLCAEPERYDADITLWRSKGGVLAEIEERKLRVEFEDAFIDEADPPLSSAGERINLWCGMTVKPSQLAAALVKVIKEKEG